PSPTVTTSPLSLCTVPVTRSPTRSLYSSNWASRSASRIRCRITCFAVCAAMRPNPAGVSSTIRVSPSCTSGSYSRATSSTTSVWGLWTSSTTSFSTQTVGSPVFSSTCASTCCAELTPSFRRYAETSAAFSASMITSLGSLRVSAISLNARTNSVFAIAKRLSTTVRWMRPLGFASPLLSHYAVQQRNVGSAHVSKEDHYSSPDAHYYSMRTGQWQ